MSSCIVCGVDGLPEAGRAADVASVLARDLGSPAVLVHVDESRGGRSFAWPAPRRHLRRMRLLQATAADSGFPSGTRFALRSGDPTAELSAIAESERAELLVISTGGLGTASPALLGGTASALMRRSPCPVLVVPPRSARRLDSDALRRIVCGVEGGPANAAVLGLAADLTARLGGELYAARRDGAPIDDAIRREADEHGAGLAVVGPPADDAPGSWPGVPATIALVAFGELAVLVVPYSATTARSADDRRAASITSSVSTPASSGTGEDPPDRTASSISS